MWYTQFLVKYMILFYVSFIIFLNIGNGGKRWICVYPQQSLIRLFWRCFCYPHLPSWTLYQFNMFYSKGTLVKRSTMELIVFLQTVLSVCLANIQMEIMPWQEQMQNCLSPSMLCPNLYDRVGVTTCCGFCNCEEDCAVYGSCCLPVYRNFQHGIKSVTDTRYKLHFLYSSLRLVISFFLNGCHIWNQANIVF